jgi:long-chain fatty acid transport protein
VNRLASMALTVLALLSISSAAIAQSPIPQPSEGEFRVEFNFSSPGARSLGLGGAFVGLADDATAAYANPAGLTNLSRPEVSVEGRSWKYTHVYPDHGHAFGRATGNGVDQVQGIVNRESSDSTQGLSFLSFAYPYKRWTFAAYRHELVNFQANITSQGVFFDAFSDNRPGEIANFRVLPSQVAYDLSIVNYGASAAYRINDRLSAGISLTYYDFSLDSITRKYGLRTGIVTTNPGDFFGEADFTTGNLDNTVVDEGSGSDFGATAGLLWKVTDNWNLGAVYRASRSFETRRAVVKGSTTTPSNGPDFRIPGAIAIGTAFKPLDQITVTVDLNHIQYSDANQQDNVIKTDDADEVHFGVEYVLLPAQRPQNPISFRLGAWLDPDHQASFRGLPDGSSGRRRLAATFLPGEDVWHYSGGLGFVWGRFQLDAAADLSDRNDIFSLSSVYRLH